VYFDISFEQNISYIEKIRALLMKDEVLVIKVYTSRWRSSEVSFRPIKHLIVLLTILQ